MKARYIVIIICVGVYLFSMAAFVGGDKASPPSKVPTTSVTKIIVTVPTGASPTSIPTVVRHKNLNDLVVQEDEEQSDCQQELGVNYCEVDDLEKYYYGGE